MSQTKAQLLDPQGDFTLNGTLIGVGATFSGNVSIAGTLTKQDVTNVDSVGVVTARQGVNIVGAYPLSLGTGTTIHAVANNELALGTNGVERLRIFSNGRIGIGTDTAPRSMVHLHNPTANDSSYIQFTNANTGGTGSNDGTLIGISQNNSNTDGTGSGFTILNKENAEITLGTNNSEKLRITSDGKLLVGTTSALDSFGSSVQYNAGTSGSFICLGRNDTTVAETNGIGGLRFYSNDTNINSGNYLRVGEINCSADGDFLSGDAPTKMTFSTVTDGTTTLVERLRIDSSGRLLLGTDTKGYSAADDLTIGNGSGNRGITIRAGTSSQSAIYFSDGTSGDDEYRGMVFYKHDTEELRLASNAATALTLDSSQNATFSGTVSDSKGNLRSIPITWQNSNTYTLLASDAGKVVSAATNGTNITVPASVFSGGDTITLMNHTGNVHTITQGTGVTMYFATDGSTGNRSLAARGFCTLFYREHNVVYISGAGLS